MTATAREASELRPCGLMDDMTWPEVAEAARRNVPVVLPVGATEQHGPHLPLSTDCLLPVGVALEVARRLRIVIAPPIRYGAPSRPMSGGGEGFPGTLSLRGATFLATTNDVIAALARSGFRQICVQNWHFENSGFVYEACELASAVHPEIRIVLVDSAPEFTAEDLAVLYPNGFPGWAIEHAAIAETSMMLAMWPDLVRRDRIIDDEAARRPPWDIFPTPPELVPASGVLWHATEATEENGHRFVAAFAGHLERAIRTEFEVVDAAGSP